MAPSGVDELPLLAQAGVFGAISAGIGAGTVALAGRGFTAVEFPYACQDRRNWRKTWPLVGGLYLAAGLAHFSSQEGFVAIYPPPGTWGFWYLPGSAEFHVAWTGIAEIAGGAGLLLGGALDATDNAQNLPRPFGLELTTAAALGLFALTVAVTPANIYMFTHGATMSGIGPPGDLPISFHAIRGAAQIVLLSLLWGIYTNPYRDKCPVP